MWTDFLLSGGATGSLCVASFLVARFVVSLTDRRQAAQVTSAAEVNREFKTVGDRAASVAFWLDRQENGSPIEQALAPQMLDVLGYVKPRLAPPEPVTPKQATWETEADRRRDHLLRHAQETTNPEVREECRWQLRQLEADRRAALDVIRKSAEAAWLATNQVSQAAGPTIERLAALYGRAPEEREPWRGGYRGSREDLMHEMQQIVLAFAQKQGNLVDCLVPGSVIRLNRGGKLIVTQATSGVSGRVYFTLSHEASGMAVKGEVRL